MNNNLYYPLKIINDSIDFFFIYFTDEIEGIICQDSKLLAFNSFSELLEYCNNNNIQLDEYDDIAEYDFDSIKKWIHCSTTDYDLNDILNLWNIFTDIGCTLNSEYVGDKHNETRDIIFERLYDLLVWEKPKNSSELKKYFNLSYWDSKEIDFLKSVLQNGLDIYKNNFVIYK